MSSVWHHCRQELLWEAEKRLKWVITLQTR